MNELRRVRIAILGGQPVPPELREWAIAALRTSDAVIELRDTLIRESVAAMKSGSLSSRCANLVSQWRAGSPALQELLDLQIEPLSDRHVRRIVERASRLEL